MKRYKIKVTNGTSSYYFQQGKSYVMPDAAIWLALVSDASPLADVSFEEI